MPIWSVVTPEEIVETLNVARHFTENEFACFVVHYATAGGTISQEEEAHVRAVSVSWYLGCRVDGWLLTGLNPGEGESPSGREPLGSSGASLAAQYYVDRHGVEILPLPRAPGIAAMVGDVPRPSGVWRDVFTESLEEADRLFTGLMTNGWKELLAKCRYVPCGCYFLLKKPRRSYRHGTFCCREHQNVVSARACTLERRARAEDELIECAARLLVRWRVQNCRWQYDTAQKRRLAAALSQRISQNPNLQGYRQEVKTNWVTRHRLEIEQKRCELTQNTLNVKFAGKREADHHDSTRNPAGFPPVLAKAIIEQYTQPGDTVLDPYGGWGAVGDQAAALCRNVTVIQPKPTRNPEGKE
jgi:hypothetical protein